MKKIWKEITKNKAYFFITFIVILVLAFSSGYFLYSLSLLTGIENFLRTCASVIIVLLWLLFLFLGFRILIKHKKIGFILFLLFSLLYSGVLYFGANSIDRVIGKIGTISTSSTTYSSSLVTLKENKANSIEEIDDSKIGILADTTSIEGNILPNEIIKELNLTNDIDEYDSFISLIQDLLEEKINYVFLPTNYSIMFSNIEGLERLQDLTKIIYTKEKEVKSTNVTNQKKKLDQPFTILLMGVDSELESIKGSTFNGDSLMLITFNPNTLNTTLLSIPRDSYVPIACFPGKRKNKITHAAWYGQDCMIETIENFTGIKIDYYAKINFKGVVKLVDAVGGVDVDVEYSFCEQDSNRMFGNNTIYVKEGFQTLNGEEALAYARNRHPNPAYCSSEWTNYVSNDFIRGQHQQDVLKALLNKIKSIRSLDTFYNLLDAISDNMETNVSTTEMLSLYNVAKDILAKSKDQNMEDLIGIQRLYLSGYDAYIYDYSPITGQGSRMNLYNFVPYQGSIKDVSNAMKINLGLLEKTMDKSFEFDVENPYEETVIGKGRYNESSIALLADLTKTSESYAKSYASDHQISLTVEYVKATNSSENVGDVISQSVPSGTDLEYVKSLTITVINKAYSDNNSSNNSINCSLEENAENSKCAMPTFKGETVEFVKNWFKKLGYDINVSYEEKPSTDAGWSEKVAGTVYEQSTTNASLYDYINTGKEFVITYWQEVEKIEEDNSNIEEPE